MGCAGTKYCNPEQQQFVWTWACREMMTLSITDAVNQPADRIQVLAPADQVRQFIEKLRAEAAKEQSSASGADAAPKDKKTSGMMAGLGGMGNMLQKGLDMASDLADNAKDTVLRVTADGLEKALAELDQPFTNAAREVFGHKDHVISAFTSIIKDVDVSSNAKDLLKGKVRRLTAEEKAGEVAMEQRQDVCSIHLSRSMKMLLASLLSTPACDGIKHHAVTKAWKSFVNTYNEANEKLGSVEALKVLQHPPIDVDVTRYIAEQTLLQVCALMGEMETAIRKDPAGKSSKMTQGGAAPTCDTFAFCYREGHDGTPLFYWEDLQSTKQKCTE